MSDSTGKSNSLWRRLHLVLCLLMVLVAVVRLATGHLVGAVVPFVLAAVFGSIAFDFPLLSRLRGLWRLLRRTVFRKK